MEAALQLAEPPFQAPPPAAAAESGSATHGYLRGSGLLLAGRFLSLGLNLVVQVLIVRYLAKGDYGAFAYGLAIASSGASVVLVGLDKAVPRFIPIYQERGEPGKVVGVVVLAAASILGFGAALVALVFGLRGVLAGGVVSDPRALSLLLVLIALAPLD